MITGKLSRCLDPCPIGDPYDPFKHSCCEFLFWSVGLRPLEPECENSMISCAVVSWWLLSALGLLLVACGTLLYRLGDQSGRSDVQSTFDDYVANTAKLAIAAEYERTFFTQKR